MNHPPRRRVEEDALSCRRADRSHDVPGAASGQATRHGNQHPELQGHGFACRHRRCAPGAGSGRDLEAVQPRVRADAAPGEGGRRDRAGKEAGRAEGHLQDGTKPEARRKTDVPPNDGHQKGRALAPTGNTLSHPELPGREGTRGLVLPATAFNPRSNTPDEADRPLGAMAVIRPRLANWRYRPGAVVLDRLAICLQADTRLRVRLRRHQNIEPLAPWNAKSWKLATPTLAYWQIEIAPRAWLHDPPVPAPGRESHS